MKKAFIIGHHLYSQGAFSTELGESEYYFNSKVGEFLKKMGNDIFYHNGLKGSYRKRCKEMAEKIKKYDVAFELHYNFFNLTSANGTEAIYWNNNELGKILAQKFINNVSLEFNTRKRTVLTAYVEKIVEGIKVQEYHRGYWMLYYPAPTTIILEPFFGSNKQDVEKFKQNHEKYAELLNNL